MLKGFFISGTDTSVGKTIVASILVNKYDAIYYKPIQCGLDANGDKDSDIVKNICKKSTIMDETYFFKKSASPNIAAKNEGKLIDINKFRKLLSQKLKKKIVIEGAGGLNVPLNNKFLMIDLVKFFGLPLILVCRTSLGTINHTLLSISLLKQKNIKLLGLVFVGNKEPETIKTILNFGKKIYGKKVKILGQVPLKTKINKSIIEKMKELVVAI